MPYLSVTQGDNGYQYPFKVKKDGIASLNNSSVKVALKNPTGQTIIKDATILDVLTCKCYFTLYSRDLTEAGTYSYQWTATFNDGRIYSGSPINFYVEASNAPTPGSGGGQGSPYATLADIKILQDQIDLLKANGANGGAGGGNDMPLVTVKDAFGGTGNITKIYTDSMVGFLLNNKGTSDITIVINSITIVVEAGAVLDELFDPFTSVVITASTPYYAEVKGYIVGTVVQAGDTIPPIITITPNGGNFATTQGVTITTNETSTIYYTIDESLPSLLSPVYNGVINLTATTTLKTFAVDRAGNQSTIQTATFIQDATAPADTTPPVVTASPNGGVFTVAQSVTLSANETSVIYYTVDGSTPSIYSTAYSSPIPINATTTLKFFGKDSAGNMSAVQIVVFTVNIPDTTPPNPVTNLAAGSVTSSTIPVSWTLSDSIDVANYEVAYSSNGGTSYTVASSAVNASSNSYTVNGLSASTTYSIRVIAIDGANNRSTPVTISATTTSSADTTPPTVTASPAAGTYTNTQSVTLTANETATIYYTLDNSTPTISSTVYSAPISVSATTTIKFFGKDTAGNMSTPVTATYTITNFSNTQNAYIQANYMYVNPSSMLSTDYSIRSEGEASHIYFSMGTFITSINLSLGGANTVNATTASNVFNGVIPYAGDQVLATFTSGSLTCPDTCYITSNNGIYIRIPASVYTSNSNNIPLSLYAISQRLPVLNGTTNDTVIVTDAIIDAMTSLSTITVTNSMWTGFANMAAGGVSPTYTSITSGVNSIDGRFISTTTTAEVWYVNATTRLNFKIPQSKMTTCDLASVKQYLKDNRLTFWIAK